ncbi:MAG TPA: lamin tail domain-containing protein [Magnetospirillaceae bacterium]|nr:lamin tail domain-containing protein [Magnetospirillaceae bacterium]
MKKAIYYTLVAAIICGIPAAPVNAQEPPISPVHILITEIQTAGAGDATEEFVELYNPSDDPVDVTGWQLQYRAASGTSGQAWPGSSTKATLACPAGSPGECRVVIDPHVRIVLVHTIANIADAFPMSGGFSGTGGQIRLVQPGLAPVIHDFVGYGTAADFETAAAAAPAAGKSLKRVISLQGEPQDTGNNVTDFIAACGNPNPGQADTNPLPFATGCNVPTLPPGDSPVEDPPVEETVEPPVTYLPLLITEVLPDPETPQQDSNDEFIELYNPNDVTVTLAGYQLQTGSGFRYHYTLGDTPLGPQRYLVIPSAVSKLSLANSGSGVRLIDPAGNIVAEVPDYGTAKEGQSWINYQDLWQWTLMPTPGILNVLLLPQPPPPKPIATPKKKLVTVKAPATAKPKTVKPPSVPKISPSPPAETIAASPKAQEPPYWVLIPLCLCVIGYGIYEYRQSIVKVWQKIRGIFTKGSQAPDEES